MAKTTKPGKVEKIVKSFAPTEHDKAQIHIADAEPLYQEIRIDNVLTDESGQKVQLKEGAEVEVHIEAQKNATTPQRK